MPAEELDREARHVRSRDRLVRYFLEAIKRARADEEAEGDIISLDLVSAATAHCLAQVWKEAGLPVVRGQGEALHKNWTDDFRIAWGIRDLPR